MANNNDEKKHLEYAQLGRISEGRAADSVVQALEQQIASGVLVDNSPLPAERELMERFGTSRTVIREAIATLGNKGLIESRPRFRPIVKKPDYGTALTAVGGIVQTLLGQSGGIKNLFDTRSFIECGLVRQAASEATKEDIKSLKQALAENHSAIDDSQRFYSTDNNFHGTLYHIPKNPVFPAIHEGFSSWLAPQWDKMERSPERNQRNYLAHEAIFQAILERDADTAEAVMKQHLQQAWNHVCVTFEENIP